MSFKDNYDFELLVNEAESIVIEELGRELANDRDNQICKCQDCVLDMAAFALNKVKPAYRSSFTGVIYALGLKDGEFMDQVTKSVKSAIEKIKKNPSHDLR